MKEGNLWKEKLEYATERFKTKSGLVDFFVGSAIWGFLVVQYNAAVFKFFIQSFAGIGNEFIQYYLSFLAFSAFFTGVGLAISFAIARALGELSSRRGLYG